MASGPRELLSSSALDSESFRVYCYKIVPCPKKFGHDWSECPFAHEGEKATRRCPALYRYSSIVCPEIRQSKACPRGDVCPYSHSIFEYWMHPARFRAQLCSFGTDCNRRICFFAHTQEQLRIPSEPVVADALASRAPYLQGRVSPESRFALYPEQVPPMIAGQGRMLLLQQQQQQQQPAVQLVAAADMGAAGLAGMPQVVYVPAGAPGQPVTVAATVPGTSMAAGQQWAGAVSSNMMFVPANQPGVGPAGMGYFVPAPGAAGAGMAAGSSGQEYASAPMLMAPAMQVVGSGYSAGSYIAGGYSSGQPVQLMTAVMGADGSVPSYSIAASGMAAGGVAYAPVYASPGAAGIPQWNTHSPQMQQQQPGQQQQQQQQLLVGPSQQQQQQQQGQQGQQGQQQPGQQPPPPPPMQLVQVQEPSDAGACGVGRTPQEGRGFILTPAGQLDAQYMMAAPSLPGAAVVQGAVPGLGAAAAAPGAGLLQQGARSSMGGGPQPSGGVDASSTDDIAQQMAAWHIQ